MKKLLAAAACMLLSTALIPAAVWAEEDGAKANKAATEAAKGPAPVANVMDGFVLTNIAAAYYANCGERAKKLNDEQIVRVATNHNAFRTLLSVLLSHNAPDVDNKSMVSFVRAASLGMNSEVALNLLGTPCEDEKWKPYRDHLGAIADDMLVKNLDKVVKKYTLDEAKKLLEGLVVPVKP